jgi:hypothetical protein
MQRLNYVVLDASSVRRQVRITISWHWRCLRTKAAPLSTYPWGLWTSNTKTFIQDNGYGRLWMCGGTVHNIEGPRQWQENDPCLNRDEAARFESPFRRITQTLK